MNLYKQSEEAFEEKDEELTKAKKQHKELIKIIE